MPDRITTARWKKTAALIIAILMLLTILIGIRRIANLQSPSAFGKIVEIKVPPGEAAAVLTNGSVIRAIPHLPLPKIAEKALNKSPPWLRKNLSEKFDDLLCTNLRAAMPTPSLVDMDGDGDADLILGCEDGTIRFYENVGGPLNAVFCPINITLRVIDHAIVQLCDVDGDGDYDIIAGDMCTLHYFKNDNGTYSEVKGFFGSIGGRGPLSPFLADMDGDGDLDMTLCVWEKIGRIYDARVLKYYENAGSNSSPKWEEIPNYYSKINAEALLRGFYRVFLEDMDGDGDLDVIIGCSDGSLLLYMNENGAWRKDTKTLSAIKISGYCAPCIADINSDGRPDLVLGSSDGLVYYSKNIGTAEEPQYVPLSAGEEYNDATRLSPIGDLYEDMRTNMMGPIGFNTTNVLREYTEKYVATYASIIANASPNIVDEIAFVVAHTSCNVLRAMCDWSGDVEDYTPSVLVENAQAIYEIGSKLKYVRIVELDNRTTLEYVNGKNETKLLPSDIYYWYVVHPRVRFEVPCYYHGDFWRTYLLYDDRYNESLYEVVKDCSNVYIAVKNITRWLQQFMDFGYESHDRQPIEIYDIHYGSCGEYSILTSAIGRAALIPTRLANDWGEDHVWNEFYDDEGGDPWHHWDNTGPYIDDPEVYERDWGKDVSCVWSIRGDDYVYPIIGKYTDYSKVIVSVTDINGRAVDGVCVVAESEYFMMNNPKYYPLPMLSIWNYTNSNGKCVLYLGKNDYLILAISEIGNARAELTVEEGKNVELSLMLTGEKPVLYKKCKPEKISGDMNVYYQLKSAVEKRPSILYYPDPKVVITGNTVYYPDKNAKVRVYCFDMAEYEKYLRGLECSAYSCIEGNNGTIRAPEGSIIVIENPYVTMEIDVYIVIR